MLLSSALAPAVSQAIRQLGETYFRENGVEIIQGEQDFVEAYVQGMDERNAVNVLMERQGDNLFASCSCSYAQKRLRPCKHIWATILAAEARRYLGEASSHDRPKLITMHDLDDLDDDPADADDDWEDSWEDEDEAEFDPPQRRPASQAIYPSASFAQRPPALSPAADSNWKNELRAVQQRLGTTPYTRPSTWPENREILYVLTLPTELLADTITINVACRTRKKNGDWGRIQFPSLDRRVIPLLPDTRDRALLGTLSSIQQAGPYYDPYSASSTLITTSLSEPLLSELLPQLCETGRCCLHHSLAGDDYSALSWDAGPAWEFRVDVAVEPAGSHYVVAGQLQRGTECRPLTAARALLRRFVFWDDGVARLTEHSDAAWMELLRRKTLRVPRKQANNFIKELVKVPRLPPLQLPDELHLEQVQGSPRFALKIRAPGKGFALSYLSADLSFEYEGKAIARGAMEAGVLDEKGRRLVLRDGAAEEEAVQRLQDLGFRPIDYYSAWAFQLPPRKLPSVVHTLLQAGWHVEAEGKLYRRAGEIKIDVTSGIDWFELHGSVAFGDAVAQLPELLAALRRGENTVQLGDGSFGVLPEEWLKKYGVLAGLGTVKDNHLEFKRSQVGLLDALLAAQPEATFDAAFSRARDELATFSRIDATDPPTGFIGQLRAYQREGLGWLHFLRRFGFGGCLADDMGLGKTIQVLALLEERRRLRAAANGERVPPSLVVVPRSLVFNWKQEAARFTPGLRVLDYTLAGRTASTDGFDQYDLVLTTYGTLRKDVPHLKDYRFDYCILDESQAVKNPNTESAKAVRLLQANQRLALSGTPIENHLGELWSLFEYLNPGMLGAASVFRLLGVNARAPAPEARELLAR
ncbi:MAG TPA: SNF2-related protein, partial [Gemmataceae bacterium]|nr:SNF2-related protein [Gemmataceae bacterium]